VVFNGYYWKIITDNLLHISILRKRYSIYVGKG